MVMDTSSKATDTSQYKEEIKMVQFKIDDLASKFRESDNKIDLGEVFPQRYPRSNNRKDSKDGLSRVKVDRNGAEMTNEAGKLFLKANCSFYGHGTEKNIDTAIFMYDQAAKMGHVKAALALGNIYEQGIGVRVNLVEAFENYHTAAMKNDPQALYKLGQSLEKGIGDKEDSTDAQKHKNIVVCYKKAVEMGSSKAEIRLAQIYENGEHNTHEVGLAQKLYDKASDSEAEAMNYIGNQCYARHEYDRAVVLFKKAESMGNITAMNNLGT